MPPNNPLIILLLLFCPLFLPCYVLSEMGRPESDRVVQGFTPHRLAEGHYDTGRLVFTPSSINFEGPLRISGHGHSLGREVRWCEKGFVWPVLSPGTISCRG